MTIVAFIFTPIVPVYQGWTYWVFRQRVTSRRIQSSVRSARYGSASESPVFSPSD